MRRGSGREAGREGHCCGRGAGSDGRIDQSECSHESTVRMRSTCWIRGACKSESGGGVGQIPVIGTDNGASAPLDARNGSVAAVAAKLLPSTVQIVVC